MSRSGRYSKPTHWMSEPRVAFFGGPKAPVIEGEIDHGRGSMRVWVVLTDELLAEVARAAVYLSVEPDREQRGHAFWHSENPEREYPCGQCSAAVKVAKEKWAERVDTAPRLSAPQEAGSGPRAPDRGET